jgi:hypothetical protein
MYMQLEDNFGDVIAKARRGQELTVSSTAGQAGLTQAALEQLESGQTAPEEAVVRPRAPSQGVDAENQVGPAAPK